MNDLGKRHARYRLQRVIYFGLSGLVVAGALGFGGLATATAAQASTVKTVQYAPPPPPANSTPGFTAVLTSVTVGPAGATVPVTSNGVPCSLAVPAGAFPADVQITITAGSPAVLGPEVQAGFHLVTGVGIQVGAPAPATGPTPYPGTFLKPLTLTCTSPAITAGSAVDIASGPTLTVDPAATVAAGTASVSFDTDPSFAVVSPNVVTPTPVPKVTVPVTGKPLLGEGILAGSLVFAGLGGLGLSRRRRARG